MVNYCIKTPSDLVTSRERIRSGFIAMALEKNYIAVKYIEEAKALKSLSLRVSAPIDLLNIRDLRVGLLTASGLSDKALNYLNEADKDIAIIGLVKEFLEPAGDHFVDELVYRYLLIKGDALGGKARNLAGTLGERKFLRTILSIFSLSGIEFKYLDSFINKWLPSNEEDINLENKVRALSWQVGGENRLLIKNANVPIVNKNVDFIVLDGSIEDLEKGENSIKNRPDRFLALGELKGGIDPAGADEHWKTANSALIRIRKAFEAKLLSPKTFFIASAIENSMASEIFEELQTEILTNAANLTDDIQLTEICSWIINL